MDLHPLPGVDLVADLRAGLPFRDNAVDRALLTDVLEHVPDAIGLMDEIHRVLRPDGTVRISVPHFSHARTYADPTHVHFFSLRTVEYLAGTTHDYYGSRRFAIEDAHLGVRSDTPLRKLTSRWPYASEALLSRTIGIRSMTFTLRKLRT